VSGGDGIARQIAREIARLLKRWFSSFFLYILPTENEIKKLLELLYDIESIGGQNLPSLANFDCGKPNGSPLGDVYFKDVQSTFFIKRTENKVLVSTFTMAREAKKQTKAEKI
jgi:hypothetical protein